MLGLGLGFGKLSSYKYTVKKLIDDYIKRVTAAGGYLEGNECATAKVRELNSQRLLDDASWLLIPEGIKEDVVYAQKPTSGLGDLVFTRASDATRTNSAGVIERTPWNLLTFSEDFSNAAWTKLGTTITPNTTTAPNGTLTADTMSIADSNSRVSQAVTLGAGTYTFSAYVKILSQTTAGTMRLQAVVDGSNVSTVFTATTEWQRVTGTFTAATGITSILIRGQVFVGDIAVWGAQVVEGTDAKPYFATTNRQDVPRLDYRNADGSLSTCPRLLLEPQRTNSIRNSTMVGAVAGSPGTLPTNYGVSTSGLTRTVIGTGIESGLQYIDLRFNGTASGLNAQLIFETVNGISASAAQSWTLSTYVRYISGTANSASLLFDEWTSASAYLNTQAGSVVVGSTLSRVSLTRTTSTNCAFVQPFIRFTLTIGAAYDFTIRIAAPQMELGAYATTFIPTTTAAVTRLADDAIKEGISSLIGQSEGTIFADIRYEVAQTSGIAISDGTSAGTNWIFFRFPNSTTDSRVYISASGVILSQVISNVFVANQSYKIALGYKSGNWALYVNGNSIASGTDTFTFSANFDRVILSAAGAARLGSAVYAKYNQAALFPTRLTNAQLVDITGGRIYYNPVEAYYAYYLTPEIPSAVITSVNSFF